MNEKLKNVLAAVIIVLAVMAIIYMIFGILTIIGYSAYYAINSNGTCPMRKYC